MAWTLRDSEQNLLNTFIEAGKIKHATFAEFCRRDKDHVLLGSFSPSVQIFERWKNLLVTAIIPVQYLFLESK